MRRLIRYFIIINLRKAVILLDEHKV